MAEEIWASQTHRNYAYENYSDEKRQHPELAGFDHADGSHAIESVEKAVEMRERAEEEKRRPAKRAAAG